MSSILSGLTRATLIEGIKSSSKSQLISCLSSMNVCDLQSLLTASILYPESHTKSKVNFYSENNEIRI